MKPLRAIVVDDSAVARAALSRVLADIEDVEVVEVARNGREALAKVARLAPDAVFLDVAMPEMDGFETLRAIRRDHAETSVVMISASRSAKRTVEALTAGAIEMVPKPGLEVSVDDLRRQLERVVAAIIESRQSEDGDPGRVALARRSPGVARPQPGDPAPLVAIGVSTGGPRALGTLLPALPPDLASPILIVQHMPAGFISPLAASLDRRSRIAVAEARDGDELTPGVALFAPGGRHMELDADEWCGYRVRLREGEPVNDVRPSIDVLFRSIAEVYAGPTLSVILTGMGEDGLEGVRALTARGGRCIGQDRASSVIYGTPRAVAEQGLANAVLPLDELAGAIAEFAAGGDFE